MAGIKDRLSNKIEDKAAPDTKKATLKDSLAMHVSAGTEICSNEAHVHDGLLNHESVKHGIREYVCEQVHINGMESFWSKTKRGHHGTLAGRGKVGA